MINRNIKVEKYSLWKFTKLKCKDDSPSFVLFQPQNTTYKFYYNVARETYNKNGIYYHAETVKYLNLQDTPDYKLPNILLKNFIII